MVLLQSEFLGIELISLCPVLLVQRPGQTGILLGIDFTLLGALVLLSIVLPESSFVLVAGSVELTAKLFCNFCCLLLERLKTQTNSKEIIERDIHGLYY